MTIKFGFRRQTKAFIKILMLSIFTMSKVRVWIKKRLTKKMFLILVRSRDLFFNQFDYHFHYLFVYHQIIIEVIV